MFQLKIHKLPSWHQGTTECGMNVMQGDIHFRTTWKSINCKKCLHKKNHHAKA